MFHGVSTICNMPNSCIYYKDVLCLEIFLNHDILESRIKCKNQSKNQKETFFDVKQKCIQPYSTLYS